VLRNLAVALGDAVDVVAEVQREVGHVEHAVAAEDLAHLEDLGPADHLPRQVQRELIVAGGHRSMGSEHALPAHPRYVTWLEALAATCPGCLVQKLQGEQRRMALVHVEALDGPIAQRPQHAHAADAKH
jgi:hypothetical protein